MTRPGRSAKTGELAGEVGAYVALLRTGTRLSLAVLVLTFVLYVGGLVAPLIPIVELPRYWGLRTGEYLRQTGLPSGWGWIRLVRFGDFLNYVGMVMLAGLTVVCYVAILPHYLRKGDTPYTLIILAEIAVLLLAASGLLTVGH